MANDAELSVADENLVLRKWELSDASEKLRDSFEKLQKRLSGEGKTRATAAYNVPCSFELCMQARIKTGDQRKLICIKLRNESYTGVLIDRDGIKRSRKSGLNYRQWRTIKIRHEDETVCERGKPLNIVDLRVGNTADSKKAVLTKELKLRISQTRDQILKG